MLKSSSSSSCLNKDSHNTKFVLPFSKVLTPLYKKLVASHNESSGSSKTKEISDIGNSENLAISADEADRFSSASSSTLFNSCSETEVDDDHHQAWFSSDTCHIGENSQQDINKRNHLRRCIGSRNTPSRTTPTLPQNEVAVKEDVRRMEKRIERCRVIPKRSREESLLSAALWGLVIHSVKKESTQNVSFSLKRVLLQKTKQLLSDRVMMRTPPRKHKKREQGFKLICNCKRRIQIQWTQHLNNSLLALDDLNSIYQWGGLDSDVENIGVEIADAILECVVNEIVSDDFEYLADV